MKDDATKITSLFPMSTLIIIITTLYNLLILSMVYNAFRSSIIVLEIISLVFLISPSFFIPLRLVVTEKSLRIWRPIGKVEISLEDIKSCTIIGDSRSIFDKTIRTFGSGGLYGFIGHFKHDKYGKMRMFVTHTKQCFLLRLKDEQHFIISSPKREEIVEFISQHIK
ncbi:MAG: hypothetical protein F082_744 [bacterium F082]|nr:MAG: hypothetical protein F082_744 [bacterium F082]KWW30731.1 MAG: hypothetical protein AUK64_623 [bacterium P201]